MSTDATSPANAANAPTFASEAPADKGKGKLVQDDVMDDEEEDEEDEDEDEEDEDGDEEMAEEESLDEIDPSVIQPRRTRGVRVDYTSAEALKKAGYSPDEAHADDDEEEVSFTANDSAMHDD